MAKKKYFKSAGEIERLIEPIGGCIASDRIAVDGCRVGYMYREPASDTMDSGWCFLAGDEDAAYMTTADNHDIYDVNTICNYDPEIIPFLGAPVGSAFARNGEGQLVPEPFSVPPQELGDKDLEALQDHVARHIGPMEAIICESEPEIIRNDLLVVKPNSRYPFYTLVTMGMSARNMLVPAALDGHGLERCELMTCLPLNWPLWRGDPELRELNSEEAAYWPVYWLRHLARLPFAYNSWLGYGHSIPAGKPFASNTKLSALILDEPHMFDPGFARAALPSGKSVKFYYVTPVYPEEVAYKNENSMEALSKLLRSPSVSPLDVRRKRVV